MKHTIDHLDLRILQQLQANAKTTNQDLADQVGLSPSSCLQRVRRLEDKGYINRYLTMVDLPKLCRSITCIATVTLKQHAKDDFDKFEKSVATIAEVVECFTVSGGFDFVLKIVCPDMTRYLELNNELVNSGANIENVSTHVVMNENKPFSGYPLETLIEKPNSESIRMPDLPQTDKLYINGNWHQAGGDRSIDVVNPATSAVIASVAQASPEAVDLAVGAAAEALPHWSATPARVRADYIDAIAVKMLARKRQLAGLITAEMGMPAQFCLPVQVEGPAEGMASYAARAGQMEATTRAGSSLVLKEPVGVCGFITPWNYPLHQIVGKCAPALAAGCTMVLKPSEITPLNAIVFAEIIEEAGLPAGVFNLVQGAGVPVGEALAAHPQVDMVSFTGSTRAGTRIAALAAPSVKRVCLELGGKSPYIVTEDADFAAAIDFGVRQVMINSGQSCDALTRMLLPASRYEEGVALARQVTESLLVGDPSAAATEVGPVSSSAQQQRVLQYLRRGLAAGARLVSGGPDSLDGYATGAFVRPTLFADVSNDMAIAREEIFGPVICIIPYRDIDAAVAIANDTPYGLSSGVWAADKNAAIAIGRRLRAGQVSINGGDFNYAAPFGGYKQSGNGREWGDAGMDEFIEIKSMQFAPD